MKRMLIAIAGAATIAWLLLCVYILWRGKGILFTWSNSPNASIPNCSTAVTRSCISGFTLTDVTADEVVSSTILPTAMSYTYAPADGIPILYSHTFTLVTNGIDSSGSTVNSVPATVTVTRRVWPSRGGVTAIIQY